MKQYEEIEVIVGELPEWYIEEYHDQEIEPKIREFFWSLLSYIYRWSVTGEKVTLKIKNEVVGTITRAGELSFDFVADETGESVEIFYYEIVDFENNTVSLYVPSYS